MRILFTTTASEDLRFRDENGDKYDTLHSEVYECKDADHLYGFEEDEVVYAFDLTGDTTQDAHLLIQWGSWLMLMGQLSEDVTWTSDGF